MLTIAICDDERNLRLDLEKKLKKFALESESTIRILHFDDGKKLIEHYTSEIDLIFLDIEMKTTDGITTAQKIREVDVNVGIIFLTSHTKYALRGYDVGAIHYIIKPIHYARLKYEMERFVEKSNVFSQESIVITNGSIRNKVLLRDLKYIETQKGSIILHLAGQKELIAYRSMKEMEQSLPASHFQRCHTSYILNMEYISGVNKLEIELLSGEKIPISQPKRKDFMEALTRYWGSLI